MADRNTTEKRIYGLMETVRRLLRRDASGNLNRLLAKVHPADVAALMRLLSFDERHRVFSAIDDPRAAAKVVAELPQSDAVELLKVIEPTVVKKLLKELPGDDAADILSVLPDDIKESLDGVGNGTGLEHIEELSDYRPDTAGGRMTTAFVAVGEDTTVAEAIKAVRDAVEAEAVFYLYVVDDHGNLVGVVSLRQLLTAGSQKKVGDIMTREVVRVTTDTDQEEVARVVSRYDLLAVPVVDEHNRLVGIVTVDDVIDVLRDEATEDMARMAGVTPGDVEAVASVGEGLKGRLPWLVYSAVAGSVVFVMFYMSGHDYLPWWACALVPLFVLLSATLSGQTATVAMRGLLPYPFDGRTVLSFVWRELRVALVFAVCFGLLVFVVLVRAADGSIKLPAAVGGAMAVSLLFASVSGTFMPVLFKRLSLDPALAAGQLLVGINAVVSMAVYLVSLALFS